MLSHFYSIYFISELLAAICATVYFYKYKHLSIWLIMPILWMAVLAESAGVLYYEFVYPNNNGIFNLYGFIYYMVFYIMIHNFIEDKRRKRIIIVLSILVIVGYIINSLTTDPIHKGLTYATIFGTFIMVIHLMYAAIEALRSERIFTLRESLPLFIFAGYLIIELTLVPVSLIRNMDLYVWTNDVYHGVNKILGVVLVIANALFIFAFIWTKPRGIEE